MFDFSEKGYSLTVNLPDGDGGTLVENKFKLLILKNYLII